VISVIFGLLREQFGLLREQFGLLREQFGLLREQFGLLREQSKTYVKHAIFDSCRVDHVKTPTEMVSDTEKLFS